jgi:chemotaxis protein CheX
MKESEIQVFIDGIQKYFSTVSSVDVSVGTPYLCDPSESPALDFTGIIGISGDRKGCVYLTAPRILLRHLLYSLGEPEADAHLISDVVGEVANTISGNARAEFGPGFMISVPVVVQGRPEKIQLPREIKAFIIPFHWRSYAGNLVVCLQ